MVSRHPIPVRVWVELTGLLSLRYTLFISRSAYLKRLRCWPSKISNKGALCYVSWKLDNYNFFLSNTGVNTFMCVLRKGFGCVYMIKAPVSALLCSSFLVGSVSGTFCTRSLEETEKGAPNARSLILFITDEHVITATHNRLEAIWKCKTVGRGKRTQAPPQVG